MANTNAPSGFLACDNIFGGEYTGRLIKVAFASTDAVAAFKGSLVKFTGASLNSEGKIPVVEVASPGDVDLAGAIQQFEPERDGNWTEYARPANTEKVAYIPADPKCLYQVQEDSVGGNIDVTAQIGNNVDFTAESSTSVLGISNMQLESASAANTATLPLRLKSVVEREDNSGLSSDANATWIVTLNPGAELTTLGSN